VIAVLGAGAMGGALASHLVRLGNPVALLATGHDLAAVRAWRAQGRHPGLGVRLPAEVAVRELTDAADVLADADVVFVAVSSPGLVPVISSAARYTPSDTVWVLATKGWHVETCQAPSEVATGILGEQARLVTLVGPGIATEIAEGLPTALLCASRDRPARRLAAGVLTAPSMLIVTTSDVAGAEAAAAYKNVAAVAVGIAEGLAERFTDHPENLMFANARAVMFAQGMMDMVNLVEARGGRAVTVLGLAGAGDLHVTCVAGRNGRFGKLLGSGVPVDRALEIINSTVEGLPNTRVALRLAQRYSVDLLTARVVDLALSRPFTGESGAEEIRDLFNAMVWAPLRPRTPVATRPTPLWR
jgi:glycerol-3-phosphate dehydrogenase (NAD(P)+)